MNLYGWRREIEAKELKKNPENRIHFATNITFHSSKIYNRHHLPRLLRLKHVILLLLILFFILWVIIIIIMADNGLPWNSQPSVLIKLDPSSVVPHSGPNRGEITQSLARGQNIVSARGGFRRGLMWKRKIYIIRRKGNLFLVDCLDLCLDVQREKKEIQRKGGPSQRLQVQIGHLGLVPTAACTPGRNVCVCGQ